jgi:hypothetical protein
LRHVRVRWTCPTCNAPRSTPFCADCGEEPIPSRDLTLRGLGEKVLHAFTSIDARTARTAWRLLRQPGELTLDWTRGVRKPYVAPFQLFLVANVIFFALQWLTAENVFSSSLDSHLNHQDWSPLAKSLVTERLDRTQTAVERYAPIFDHAVVVNAKSLIIVMAFAFACVLPLVFVRERQPFMLHVVFALHLYTFLLLLFSLALVLAWLSSVAGCGGLASAAVDNVLSILNVVACAAYLHVAIRRTYGVTGAQRVLQTVMLVVTVAAIVLGYRFLVFLVTLYTT